MDYYCEVCNIFIKPEGISKHLGSIRHTNLDKNKHKKLSMKNANMDDIAKIFHTYISNYKKRYDYYYVTCKFELILTIFSINQSCLWLSG